MQDSIYYHDREDSGYPPVDALCFAFELVARGVDDAGGTVGFGVDGGRGVVLIHGPTVARKREKRYLVGQTASGRWAACTRTSRA